MDQERPRLSRGQISAIRNSTHAINIWSGAVRSGKTAGWILVMLDKVRTATDDGEIVIMGRSLNSIYRNVFRPIETEDMYAMWRSVVRYRQGASTATIFGKTVHVIGASDVSAEASIRGMTMQLAFVDEVTLMPEVVFSQLMTRLSKAGAQLFATTNPGSSNHYLRTDYILKPKETDTYHCSFVMDDNPGLKEDFKRRQKAQFSGVFYRRMVLGQWVAAEGAIYEGWDDTTMTIRPEDIPASGDVLSVGIDYGTNHPTAGYALQVGTDNRLYITREWSPNLATGRKQRLTDYQLADDLERWLDTLPSRPRYIYADPAAASFREELKQRHILTYPADNSVADGIRVVDASLTNGLMRISTDCKHLINEIPEYRWDPKKVEKGKDEPIKEADDHVDAMRYTVASCRHIWRRLVRDPQPTTT